MSDERGETVEPDADADDGTPTGNDVDPDTDTDADAADVEADDAADGADEAEETEETAEPGGGEEAVADRIADEDAETVAAEIVELRERVAELKTERDDAEERLRRKAAEFQNYKKRQEKRREEVRERATEALVEELLEVRDNLDRALEQEADADIRDGVEATFRQFDEVLAGEDVEPIEPSSGAEVDPTRHEVLLNVESDRPAGTVAEVHRPGYEMAGKVLRPAQVTVAEGEPEQQ
ncbi:nucleotide exchange factor GrpE [Halobacteriales archaeon QS_8_69_73]|nr:MAG: nucleotide exchange factor GrpE [Halobacteriales archaeon QS_8_69_73]